MLVLGHSMSRDPAFKEIKFTDPLKVAYIFEAKRLKNQNIKSFFTLS